MAKHVCPEEDQKIESPSLDRSDRFPLDALLRAVGCRIHRRGRGEPFWEIGGEIVPQSLAVLRLDPVQARRAANRQRVVLPAALRE